MYAVSDLSPADKADYAHLKAALVCDYSATAGLKITRASELARRFQLPSENLDMFTSEIISNCKKIGLDKSQSLITLLLQH
jgi:hypothetical protein